MDPPGWFAGEGWELTPETAGIARASNTRLQQRPITAHVRRRSDRDDRHHRRSPSRRRPAFRRRFWMRRSMGKPVGSWRIDPAKDGINFFHVLQLPQGIPAGPGDYADLTLTARAESAGVATPEVAVEQFDIQPVTTVMFALRRRVARGRIQQPDGNGVALDQRARRSADPAVRRQRRRSRSEANRR